MICRLSHPEQIKGTNSHNSNIHVYYFWSDILNWFNRMNRWLILELQHTLHAYLYFINFKQKYSVGKWIVIVEIFRISIYSVELIRNIRQLLCSWKDILGESMIQAHQTWLRWRYISCLIQFITVFNPSMDLF